MKETEAARAVLLEVLNALGAMRNELVIVGGWVPDLLYPTSNHMGSLDVDLAVSPNAIGGNAYSSIRKRLTKIGYTMHESPTRFFKHLPGLANPIKIDLITGLYVSQQKQDSILVDEIRINALRGIDLARKVHGLSRTGIGKDALQLLRAKFRTFDSVGPIWAGRAAATAGEDTVQFQRAAFEDADDLFRSLDAI
ncbi:MAG: hypothetical protein SGI77_01720 [Pirellulaceae bacterium]|nr:hypothetical protein [Pirellulaceae bacterium]